jgi:hypothetical protein
MFHASSEDSEKTKQFPDFHFRDITNSAKKRIIFFIIVVYTLFQIVSYTYIYVTNLQNKWKISSFDSRYETISNVSILKADILK